MEKNTYDVSIDLKPWTEKGYRIVKLHMIEKLGGFIPSGELDLWHTGEDDPQKLITDQKTGTLILKDNKEGGLVFEIPIFITSRQFFRNTLTLKFICIKDKKFFTELQVKSYDDITDALNALYPGKIDIRIESDFNNNIPIHQWGESNYDLCTKLAYSFKKKSIFAYGWEGFLLKDLCGDKDSRGNSEPKLTLTDLYALVVKPYTLNYSKRLNHSPYNTWEEKLTYNNNTPEYEENSDYKEKEFVSGHALRDYNKYNIVGPDYEPLVSNYLYNRTLMDVGLYSSITIKSTDMPNYKIGDTINYTTNEQDSDYPFKIYTVFSNEIFYTQEGSDEVDCDGLRFSWTSVLLGNDQGKWSSEEDDE